MTPAKSKAMLAQAEKSLQKLIKERDELNGKIEQDQQLVAMLKRLAEPGENLGRGSVEDQEKAGKKVIIEEAK